MNPRIIATIGPKSEEYDILSQMAAEGMNIMRVNFSHATESQWHKIKDNLARIKKETGADIKMMADLQGPRIRLGVLQKDVEIVKGATYIFFSGKANVAKNELPIDYPDLHKFIKQGQPMYLSNRLVELRVEKVSGKKIFAKAVTGGVASSRKGINVPETIIAGSALTKKDIKDAKFVAKNGADYVCLSFVQTSKDVEQLRKALADDAIDIIAKIERASALDHIDSIIKASNGIMIARGDLGIEMPIEELTIIQKNLIRHAHQYKRPAIVATQMLDSMAKNPYPTRAEAADVANAIFDGADAVMLSDETASGNYPVMAVSTMKKIAKKVDEYFNSTNYFEQAHGGVGLEQNQLEKRKQR
ncbi:MAG: pyruvate kinase [Candidatus Staskawiczbacteria bacterium RIFCSPLOWO2_01_FULL_40_39]|uniref:Pyruvate kinase n=1 Tax=Candidatus Staskawiczbacteria bacterium RIFCSPHIGHO2_01_FULL_39_25 TaxID=1802202 RepID=A0A1G2HMR6_9BACT|nr:MAG: pyruvate kinase [Candidatus Staskawiczbacteria bacterium RIFCSPHIGHO2_01_FULL_39_25]OGZ73280.1 MAG: pyruvate kinase [Candidatus Staskawiczbacteria bacterium RIFCSPLOWO2_01_FULL_40_39]OGZ75085.1 MAG: pyruvate kinase [Candidatus Staskawiczbacteria bacterium RIFCSPLOWO2_02_FULL_39_8]